MKKKYLIVSLIIFFSFIITVLALSASFSFDASKLSFTENSKSSDIKDKFSDEYELTYSLTDKDAETEETIKELTKKTTYLLIGEMNEENEPSEKYYQRKQDFFNMGLHRHFPKDSSTSSGYDEKNPYYSFAVMSEITIPQLFYSFNELGIVYNSYGDIRVITGDDLAISSITLHNVKMKEENPDNPIEYNIVNRELNITYYFIKVDDEYYLGYYYGETTDDVEEYINELGDSETTKGMAISSSYESDLSSIYDFSKVNNLSQEKINTIYNNNLKNIAYIRSYYNNKVLSTANGIFINDGIVLTTWRFLEDALINSQYIVIKDNLGNVYDLDGIITCNPQTDVAVLKLKEKSNTKVTLGQKDSIKTEDPAIVLSSKSGTGLTIQKGIVINNDQYLETSIPLSESDEGSPVFNQDGELIGLNTIKSTNNSISVAINVDVMKEIQDKFNKIDFNSIKVITFDDLKEEYFYTKYNQEKIVNSIPKSKWKKYKKIGDIENNIKLELIKASYEKGTVSLRYKNNITNFISSMQLSTSFKAQLEKDGYKNTLNTNEKSIYQNKEYKVIIMDEFDYLIIVMVKL